MVTITFTFAPKSSQNVQKNSPDRLDTKICHELRLSVHSIRQATLKITKTQI